MENWINGSRISRENNYNILRLMAATAVMYGHMYVLMGSAAPVLYANEINAIGFKMLMVLSGYMITQSCIYDGKASHYIMKRAFRILPALIVVTLITMFVIGPILTEIPVNDYFKHEYTWQYLYNIILIPQFQLPAVFSTNPYPYTVNGSLWGLPIEVSCYVFVYIILKILCKFRKRKIAFATITFLVCAFRVWQIVFLPEASYVLLGTDWWRALTLYPYFFIGALYAVTNIRRFCNVQVAFVLMLLSIAFRSDLYVVNEVLAMLLIPYMLISLGECAEPIFARCLKNVDVTYGIYLWGFTVQQVLILIIVVKLQYNININIMFILSFVITAILAYLSWIFIEKPASGLMKKILKLL